MTKKISVDKNGFVVDKNGFVFIEDFKDLLNVEIVQYYTIKTRKDKTVVVKFYDKNRKLVRPYEQK